MAESAVTFLLNKLTLLLCEEDGSLRGFREEVEWIKDELECMRTFLRVADSMEDDDEEVRVWLNQVRDVAFDTEDVLDKFILRSEHTQGGSPLYNVARSVKTLRARHDIVFEIQSIKPRIEYISQGYRRCRYKFEVAWDKASSSSFAENNILERRGDALLIEEAELVGIEQPKKQLAEWLLEADSILKVVSVVGMGGLGKTTLVKNLYDDVRVKAHFQSHAWINVSQSFKLEELLKDIIRQLCNEENQPVPESVGAMSLGPLKATIKKFLIQRRYVLVLDDVWNVNDWDEFRYALPNNNYGSRVILTTRVTQVASRSSIESRGHVYFLKPLSSEESWALFCRKTFPTHSCPPQLIQLSQKILKRCEGLPLAIVAIGGVLSTKDSNDIHEWEIIHRNLGVELQSKYTFRILSLGFNDLPYYLKSCFVYLSIFPEDYMIEHMRLIRLWIAEGFVEEKYGKTLEEVANEYLVELLNRSMIQIAEVTIDGRVKTCRVHDLIREIILSKSKDHIFVAANAIKPRWWPQRIRCVSIHNSITTNVLPNKSSVSRLRSLLMFGFVHSLPSISMPSFFSKSLKLLKVLDLTGAPLEIFPEDIVQLINLRYLSLRDTKLSNLPNSIGKLRNLETLDLKGTYITELPIKISKLKRLRHLLVYLYNKPFFNPFPSIYGFTTPSGIGELLSLQKLSYINANPCIGNLVEEIGKLNQLRRLGITRLRKEDGETLCSSIGKLCNLRSLSLHSIQEDEIIDLQHLASPPKFLRFIQLEGRLEQLPHWIPFAHGLVKVSLMWSRLKDDPLESLGYLPNLVSIDLLAAYDGETLCFKGGGFPRLKELILDSLEELRVVTVEVGAMPKLEQLNFSLCEMLERVPSGIANLANLNLLKLSDMHDKLIQMLNPNQEGGDYSIIAHVSKVRIAYTTQEGHLKEYDILGKV